MADPYFNKVKLLLHFDGVDGSQSFTDSSAYGRAITAVGNAQISNVETLFGQNGLFDGTGDRITLPASSDWVLSSTAFTIELWFKTTQSNRAYATLMARGNAGFGAGSWTIMASGATAGVPTIYWADYSAGSPFLVSSSGGYNDGNWHHLAWVKNGNVHTLYLDGVSKASTTTAAVMADCGTPLVIGTDLIWTPRDYAGRVEEARITDTVARYTANFTAPASAFDDTPLLQTARASQVYAEVFSKRAPFVAKASNLYAEVLSVIPKEVSVLFTPQVVPHHGKPYLRIQGANLAQPLEIDIGGTPATILDLAVDGTWVDISVPRGRGVVDMSVVSGPSLVIVPEAFTYKKKTGLSRIFRR